MWLMASIVSCVVCICGPQRARALLRDSDWCCVSRLCELWTRSVERAQRIHGSHMYCSNPSLGELGSCALISHCDPSSCEARQPQADSRVRLGSASGTLYVQYSERHP